MTGGGWAEPAITWARGVDPRAQHHRLRAEGQLLTTWAPAPFERAPTDCFRHGAHYWIWQPEVGGIRFTDEAPALLACPAAAVAPAWFDHLVRYSWLPAILPLWGRQVLHASAVARVRDGAVVAFLGAGGAGKSTLAYGLAQRAGWTQVSDDALAFAVDGDAIVLHPVGNQARLRPASAAHFGRPAASPDPLPWPARPLHLARICVLTPAAVSAPLLTPLSAADRYRRLLGHANAMSLAVPEHNRRLLRDYLALATRVRAVSLSYPRTFEALDAVYDLVVNDVERSDRALPLPPP